MKTRIITVCLLFMHLLFAGCSKEEAIDNVDPDVPEVEIPEEEMEIAIQNLERVDQKMQPLFQASESLDDLAQHLDEIKAMEGVEDAWADEDAETLWIQIEKGGKVAYYYPIKFSVDESSLLKSSTEAIKMIDTKAVENKNVCIINQVSNDLEQSGTTVSCQILKSQFESAGFSTTIINCEEFTRDFINTKMPQFEIVFLITHGELSKFYVGELEFSISNLHWLLTGEKVDISDWTSWDDGWNSTKITFGLWSEDAVFPITEKRMLNSGTEASYRNYYYLAVSENYLRENMNDFSSSNSILFNTACHSLEGDSDLWLVFKDKKVGAYLGLDNTNSIGVKAGVAFFENMLAGMTVSEAFNALPAGLKNEKGVHNNKEYDATLHCYPSDCQITLFGEPEVTDEEAVDLGLNVKWAKKNLGASNYTDKGNGYEDYKYMDIYYEDPILVGEDGEDVNLSGNEKYDYARKELGGSWRMPTFKDWQELKEKCTWKTATIDDKPGFLVTGPNGKNIFLPGKQYQQPVMGIQYYDGLYATGTLNQVGLRSFYIVGSMGPYGINTCQIEDMWIADTAFIRPVCD